MRRCRGQLLVAGGAVPVVPGVLGLWQAGGQTGGISTARRGWVHVQFGWAPELGAEADVSAVDPGAAVALGLVAVSAVWKQRLPWLLLQPEDWAAAPLPVTWEAPWGRPGYPRETGRDRWVRRHK